MLNVITWWTDMINIMAIAKTIIILSSSYGYVSFDGFNGQVQLTTC